MSGPASATAARPFATLLDARSARSESGWLAGFRAAGRARFEQVGLPDARDEDWRQTNVRPLAGVHFVPAARAALTASSLLAHPIASASPVRLVLINGRIDLSLSALGRLPAGVRVSSLAEAAGERMQLAEAHLGRSAPVELTPFAALNAATFEDGILITIDANVSSPEPIHVLHVVVGAEAPAAIAPRMLVVAAEDSSAVVIETFLGLGRGTTLTNAVTEIALAAGARLDHVKIQTETDDAWHVAAVAGHVSRGARLASHNVSLGARLARNDIGAKLDGEGAACTLYGLYLADGGRHVDNHTWLDHAQPHCPSWEMYKGVLAGSARAVFNGRIVVRAGAQKTDAKQSNKNLILSDGAVVHTRPQLEIYANDVRCTHGATIGRLDEGALFYLRSRGIGAKEARDLLIHAFADDILAKIPAPVAREVLSAAIYRRLDRNLET